MFAMKPGDSNHYFCTGKTTENGRPKGLTIIPFAAIGFVYISILF